MASIDTLFRYCKEIKKETDCDGVLSIKIEGDTVSLTDLTGTPLSISKTLETEMKFSISGGMYDTEYLSKLNDSSFTATRETQARDLLLILKKHNFIDRLQFCSWEDGEYLFMPEPPQELREEMEAHLMELGNQVLLDSFRPTSWRFLLNSDSNFKFDNIEQKGYDSGVLEAPAIKRFEEQEAKVNSGQTSIFKVLSGSKDTFPTDSIIVKLSSNNDHLFLGLSGANVGLVRNKPINIAPLHLEEVEKELSETRIAYQKGLFS